MLKFCIKSYFIKNQVTSLRINIRLENIQLCVDLAEIDKSKNLRDVMEKISMSSRLKNEISQGTSLQDRCTL